MISIRQAVLAGTLLGWLCAGPWSVSAQAESGESGESAQSAENAETPEDLHLTVGQTARFELAKGAPKRSERGGGQWFGIQVEQAGPLTVDVESHDLDVFVFVRDGAGETIARDMNSGVYSDAHLVFAAEAGQRYRIGALAGEDGAGEIRVTVREGTHAVPTGPALQRATLDYHRRSAERAAGRGDVGRQGQSLVNAVSDGFNFGLFADVDEDAAALRALADAHRQAPWRTISQAFSGSALVSRDRHDEAVAQLESGLEGARAMKHADIERFVLAYLGDALLGVGRERDAIARWEELRVAAVSMGHARDECVALRKQGVVHAGLGDYDLASEQLQAAADAARRAGELDLHAHAQLELGNFHKRRGDFGSAEASYQLGLDVSVPGGTRMALVGGMGNIHLEAGRYGEARRHYQDVLEYAEAAGDTDKRVVAQRNLAVVDFRLGHRRAAIDALEFALAELPPDDHRARSEVLSNLSVVWRTLGESEQRRRALQSMLDEATEGGLAELVTLALTGLSDVALEDDGDLQAARSLIDRALAGSGAEEMPRVHAIALVQYADIAFESGQFDEATATARTAVDMLLDQGDTATALEALRMLGFIAYQTGDVAGLTAIVAEAEPLLDAPPATGLGAEELAGVRSRFADWSAFEQDLVAMRLDAAGGDAARRAAIVAEGFQRSGRWKGRSLLEGIGERRSGGRSEEASRLRSERFAVLAERAENLRRLARAEHQGADAAELDRLAARAEALWSEADALEQDLHRLAPRDAALDVPRGVPAETAQRALLAPGRVLIDYVDGSETLYAYVLTHADVRFVPLGDRDAIEESVAAFRACFTDPGSLADAPELTAQGHALAEQLLAPLLAPLLAAAGDTVHELLVVPTGALAALPFEALVLSGAGAAGFDQAEFVLDRWRVDYGPSTTVLVALSMEAERRGAGRVLALGDPTYPVEQPGLAPWAATGLPRSTDLDRLPATRDEIVAIADVVLRARAEEHALDVDSELSRLRSERSVALTDGPIDAYLGAEASPDLLQGDLRPYSIIHCASHGYVDPDDPRRSSLALAFRPDQPGYFPLADVLALDLDADLTVLSACRTAEGRLLQGEGVQSLARAFMYAGSRSVVASLWQVSDLETSVTMGNFYQGHMIDGRSVPEALRDAKLALRHGRPLGEVGDTSVPRGKTLKPVKRTMGSDHPYYWAPFIHVGRP